MTREVLIKNGQLYVPLFVVAAILSFAIYLKGMSKDVEAAASDIQETKATHAKDVSEVKAQQKEFNEVVRSIDRRLSNIEGALGAKVKKGN